MFTSGDESLELPHNSLFCTFPVTDDDAYTGCLHSQCNASGKEEVKVEGVVGMEEVEEVEEVEGVEEVEVEKKSEAEVFERESTTESKIRQMG